MEFWPSDDVLASDFRRSKTTVPAKQARSQIATAPCQVVQVSQWAEGIESVERWTSDLISWYERGRTEKEGAN